MVTKARAVTSYCNCRKKNGIHSQMFWSRWVIRSFCPVNGDIWCGVVYRTLHVNSVFTQYSSTGCAMCGCCQKVAVFRFSTFSRPPSGECAKVSRLETPVEGANKDCSLLSMFLIKQFAIIYWPAWVFGIVLWRAEFKEGVPGGAVPGLPQKGSLPPNRSFFF